VWNNYKAYVANTIGGKSLATQCYQGLIYCDIHIYNVSYNYFLCGILCGKQC